MSVDRDMLADGLEWVIADWDFRLADKQPTRPLADELADAVMKMLALHSADETDWEYEGRPFTSNPDEPEWAGRGIAECEALVTEHANPNHWIHAEHNSDLEPVVGYRVYRHRKAGSWEKVLA